MSKVEQISAAILALSPNERTELLHLLPTMLPELDGDREWERIIRDSKPRAALTSYIDEIKSDLRDGTLQLRETSDREFERES